MVAGCWSELLGGVFVATPTELDLELIRFRGQFHAASTAPSYSASYRAGAT